MTTIATRMTRGVSDVVVEYDGPTGRERKTFPGVQAARRFYTVQMTAGKNPRVVSAERS